MSDPKPFKFTDQFFIFPTKVFHDLSEDFDEGEKSAIGWARVPYHDLYNAHWFEGFSRNTNEKLGLEDKEGERLEMDLTVFFAADKKYLCTWGIKEFERNMNKFMAKLEPWINEQSGSEEDLIIGEEE